VLIIGDLNSYAMEDPITALKSAGYTNLVDAFIGSDAYSYVYDGQWGYLDHALANPALLPQVSGVVEYHINSDEPSVLDYNTDYKTAGQLTTLYAADQYRVSDHDPIIIGLNLNAKPIVNAGGPYEVDEGGQVTVSAAGSDPDGGAVEFAWDLDNDGAFETAGQSATIDAVDGPASALIKVQATDATGLSAVAETTLTIQNVAPVVDEISVSYSVKVVKKNIVASADFSDPGVLDTHTAVWDWGDGTTSTATVTEADGSGSVSDVHAYTAAGFYQVTLIVTDKDGGEGQAVYDQIVVYNPKGGYLLGAGIIDSPAGAFLAKPDLTGKATFSILSKYLSGASVPTGVVTFQFPAGKMTFISLANEWLVVNPDLTSAQIKGRGRINGEGNYQFMLWAGDGSPDTLRIKIWYMVDGSEVVVYDNGAVQPIRSGAITIRK